MRTNMDEVEELLEMCYNEVPGLKDRVLANAKRDRAYRKEYNKQPNVIKMKREYAKEYSKRPNVRRNRRKYMRDYYKRPEVIERRRISLLKRGKQSLNIRGLSNG